MSLLLHLPQGRTRAEVLPLKNGEAVFNLDKRELGDGVNRFTIFDQNTRPVAERLYFKRPARSLAVDTRLDQGTYATRQKVSLTLSTDADTTTDLSVAVYLLDSLPQPTPATIDSYLLLTSGLSGTVESPGDYLQQSGPEADESLDLLMLTHGWTRYDAKDMRPDGPDNSSDNRFAPEYRGHFIKGRVIDTRTEQPISNVTAFLAAPDLRPKLFLANSDAEGNIRFEVDKLYDNQDVIVQTDYRIDSTYRIEISSPFSERYSGRRWPQYAPSAGEADAMLNRSINMQATNAFNPLPQLGATFYGADTLAFYGRPDEKYFLDAYTRFPTTEEVMREYVPGVFVKKRQGKFRFNVLDKITPQGQVFRDEPLILMDGVPVFNTDRIMAFDPLKIRKLEVIDGMYYLGPRSFPGIVSYSTYKGDLAGLELDPRALVIAYDFAQSKKQFYAPRYETADRRNSRLPDFRNLLLWAPTLTTDAQGKRSFDFYTSDQTGTYRVVVQGITAKGTAGSQVLTFEVKPEARQ